MEMPRKEPPEEPSNGEMDDVALVSRCRTGDKDAWGILFTRYRQRLFGLCYQFVADFQESEDLVQEIFLKLTRVLDKYDSSQSFKAWLTAVGRNHCIDHYRKHAKRRRQLLTGEDVFRTIPDRSPGPMKRAVRKEEAERLRRALADLSEKLREAVVLRDIQGYTYEEVGKRLKIPVGTVKSRLNRGREDLAGILRRADAGKERT